MTPVRMLVQSLVKGLKVLTAEAERMEKLIKKLEGRQAPKPKAKAKAKRAKKEAAMKRPAKATDQDMVFAVISKSKRGVTTAQIKEKTGFAEKKVWNVINRIKKQGKVKSAGRGVYVKV